MKIKFSIFIFGFALLPFLPHLAAAEFARGVDLQGCRIYTEAECAMLGLSKTEEICFPELASPHIPTPSAPRCPENSSFHANTGKCQCFQGTFVSGDRCIPYMSPNSITTCRNNHFDAPLSACPQIPAPNEVCRQQYGDNIHFSSEVQACVCDADYTLTAGDHCARRETPQGFLKTKKDLLVEYTDLGRDHFLFFAPQWDLKSAVTMREGKQYAVLNWYFTPTKEQSAVDHFHVVFGDATENTWLFDRPASPLRQGISFWLQSTHTYIFVLEAIDKLGAVLGRTIGTITN